MSAPSFTTLLDWVDDRLGSQDAAVVARFVEASPDAQEVVEWIHEFRAAGLALPLTDVPKTLTRDLRASFRRHRAPWISGPRHEVSATYDSRVQPPLAGMRSALTDQADHLVIVAGGTELRLTLVGGSRDEVDLHGTVAVPPGSGRPEVVFSSASQAERRSVRPGRDGQFVLKSVSRMLDEVWVLTDGHPVHGLVDLSISRT